MTQAMGAVCEIKRDTGDNCGITAIGRCATCGLAFCLTHQGRVHDSFHGWISYVDRCAPCTAVQQAEEAKHKKDAYAPQEYFKSGTARKYLLAAGVPSTQIYQVWKQDETKWGILGRRYISVDKDRIIGRGWILGEFIWHYDRNRAWHTSYEDDNYVDENWLTVLMDLSDDDLSSDASSLYNSTLVRVQPYADSYQVLHGSHDRFGGRYQSQGWIEAMQAVKRLIEKSS